MTEFHESELRSEDPPACPGYTGVRTPDSPYLYGMLYSAVMWVTDEGTVYIKGSLRMIVWGAPLKSTNRNGLCKIALEDGSYFREREGFEYPARGRVFPGVEYGSWVCR